MKINNYSYHYRLQIYTKTDRKITHFFLPQSAQNASNCISGDLFFENFPRGMPPDPPRGTCTLGTRHTLVGYFSIWADYFKICGEHCTCLSAGCSKRYFIPTLLTTTPFILACNNAHIDTSTHKQPLKLFTIFVGYPGLASIMHIFDFTIL